MKKLSICIPTYNRANMLDVTLGSMVRQLQGYENEIELIVSNNCSEDNTEEVVMKYKEDYPIVYYQMSDLIHGIKHFDHVISNFSRGEYTILVGDDDLILSGSIPKIMELIRDSKYEYIYINHCFKSSDELLHIINTRNACYKASPETCECFNFESKEVSKWEEILTYKGLNPGINMLFIGSHLIKTKIWKENRNALNFALDVQTKPSDDNILFENEIIYEFFAGQIIILSKAMMGKKCFYCGEPLIIQGIGEQTADHVFSQYFARIMWPQLKWFQKCGIDKEIYIQYKEMVDENVLTRIANVMNYKREYIKNFPDFLQYIDNNINDMEFFKKLYDTFSNDDNNHSLRVIKGVFHNELNKYLTQEQQNIVLWGTGDVAKSLLQEIKILKSKINIVVDASVKKQGTRFELLDIQIESPDSLKGKDIDLIIISTIKYEEEVINFIEEELKIKTVVLASCGIINLPLNSVFI